MFWSQIFVWTPRLSARWNWWVNTVNDRLLCWRASCLEGSEADESVLKKSWVAKMEVRMSKQPMSPHIYIDHLSIKLKEELCFSWERLLLLHLQYNHHRINIISIVRSRPTDSGPGHSPNMNNKTIFIFGLLRSKF